VARRRPRPPSFLVRSGAPVCGRTAPRRRSRRAGGDERARAHAGRRHVRRHRADRREDGVDRDAARLHGDAGPSRIVRRPAGSVRDGGRRRRHGRDERRRRPRGPVRLLRPAHDGAGAGLRRPARVLAGAARCGRPGPRTATRLCGVASCAGRGVRTAGCCRGRARVLAARGVARRPGRTSGCCSARAARCCGGCFTRSDEGGAAVIRSGAHATRPARWA